MKVVFAPDSFKECLPAAAVAEALAAGWRRVWPETNIVCAPMADGGEGTVDAVALSPGAVCHSARVCGPLGEPVTATWVTLDGGLSAVIEVASAAGLMLLPPEARDPRRSTTRGVGELILAAVAQGATRVIVGLGGSATNDGGAGLAQALGYRLLDADDHEMPPGGAALGQLTRIDSQARNPLLDGITIIGATDVTNPLCGPEGASQVFGPQKGADVEMVQLLDQNLEHLARIVQRDLGLKVHDLPGAGAAGGLGAGLVAFVQAELRSGAALVAEAIGLEQQLADATLVITGEGRLDAQSLSGKVPLGVAEIAARHGVSTIVVAGCLGEGWGAVYEHGVSAVFSLSAGAISIEEARAGATDHLEAMGESLARLWRVSREKT